MTRVLGGGEAGGALGGRYELVLDTSWAHYGTGQLGSLLAQVREAVSHSLRKRLERVYLVHPTSLVARVLPLARQLFPAWVKVRVCYDWRALEQYIAPEHVSLPAESLSFTCKAYPVTKVNAKGKRQARLVKFTALSLLNIDPRSHSLQNEKLLADIELLLLPSPLEIRLRFRQTTPRGRIGYLSQGLKWPLEYHVTKQGGLGGGGPSRIYKVILDSLLILDQSHIMVEGEGGLRLEFHEGLGATAHPKRILCRTPLDAHNLAALLRHQAALTLADS